MLESQEPEIKNKRIAWGTELCFYFGLTKAQVESMYTNWRTVYTASYNTVRATIPSLSTYQNSVGYGYWQWADSWVTEPDNISVAGLGTNTIQGYYEMSYWQQAYLNAGQCGSQNVAAFSGIQFFNDISQPGTNYEHLF